MTCEEDLIPPALLGFDTETTGLDVQKDRIVSAAVVAVDADGEEVYRKDWLINPGILIPRQATKIHGITNEQAAEEGQDPAEAIDEIVRLLAFHLERRVPLVIQNAPYDLTLLEAEARRYGHEPLSMRAPLEPVLDPVMLSRAAGVEGSHKLSVLCQRYGVSNPKAHTAYADTVTTLAVLRRLLAATGLKGEEPMALHAMQLALAKEKAANFQADLRAGAPCAVVEPSWPVYGSTRTECECRECGRTMDDDEFRQPCAECRSRYPVAAV